MNDKIAIVLEYNDGKYSFKTVTEILNKDNCIDITNSDFNHLIDGYSINIKTNNINTSKDIELVFNQKDMYDALIKSGKTDKEAKASIKEILKSIGSSIKDVVIKEDDGIQLVDINTDKESTKYNIDISSIDPDKIVDKVKEKVISQDETVNTVVRNIYNNQLIIDKNDEDLISSQKTSILLDGPTGTGKTLIMKEICKEMNLPIVIKPSTMYATTGYRGVELQDMLVSLLKETNGDLEAAERGVIVLDEFDKLGNSSDNDSSLEIRKAVQQDLLTYIGGSKFDVSYEGKTYEFDTSKLTFICLGAFTNMREKKQDNLDENGNYIVNEEDYIDAGIMRELVGRFQLITSTNSLSKEDFIKILKESSISPINKLIELGNSIYNANIIFDDEIIDEIATYAFSKDTGARALNTVINGIRNTILKDLNESRKTEELTDIKITKEMLEKVKEEHIRKSYKNEIEESNSMEKSL